MDDRLSPTTCLFRSDRQATRVEAITGRFDRWLLFLTLALAALGAVMVASASLAVAESHGLATTYYLSRHLMFLVIGGMLAWMVMRRGDVRRIEQHARWLPLAGVLLLLLVLVPGLGHTVKGARRWIDLGFIGFQPAEAVKLITVVWLASYLARFADEVKGGWKALGKVFGVAAVFCVLLLAIHRDFGTAALVLGITAGMLVLGGINMPKMLLPAALATPALAWVILMEPYRVERLVSFSNPWADPFGAGYQLTNALMAMGRGEFSGVGLGGSVQKLSYLPEAHTDFIMAVIGEELGFVGVCLVVALYAGLVGRALWIGLQCVDMRRHFAGYLAFGIGLWLAMQAFVSIGVNLGLLPTKGLTLPLISSGGSSVLVTCVALGLLLRVSWELERARRQVALRRETLAATQAAAPVSVLDVGQAPAHAGNGRGEGLRPEAEVQAVGGMRAALARLFERAPRRIARQRIEPSLGGVAGR
ncbi:putative lipid II flippase FtsW [Luteimonas sp. e5]